jgi:hypothetical protein
MPLSSSPSPSISLFIFSSYLLKLYATFEALPDFIDALSLVFVNLSESFVSSLEITTSIHPPLPYCLFSLAATSHPFRSTLYS